MAQTVEKMQKMQLRFDLHYVLIDHPEYRVVHEYTARHDYGYSETQELCRVTVDHDARTIELEFE